ncbi:sulfur carrier protein ThiS [Alkalihalobacillus trypoxylicola]|uniref:Thiamine biosynthesis protein ThiS n=1 Tax=Alkalihalobacillus trypoxylicola TaxID=519424 RepID=A0A162EFN9_9BACI|nr:sulfur carrier protein ThiS [Alkalihalobacillus trypoxylicola]KYG32461.1 thiamine biosynthesis protein ThiS [Alkalihalobacillus trypoxylicola]
MNLLVNGEEHQLEVKNLTELIQYYKLEPQLVVVELNGVIIEREKWEETVLEENNEIELVHFVGGG